MFKRTGRTANDNFMLGGIFVFLGGYAGVLTSMVLGHFVNCMTGNSTEIGMSIGHLDLHESSIYAFILFCFIFGAFLSTKIIENVSGGHRVIMLIESVALIGVIGAGETVGLFLAGLAMGMQNGMTTYTTWTEGGKIRSTHVTGTSTDIGVSLSEGDMEEFTFTVFQALVYFAGAVAGYFAFLKFDRLGFATVAVAVFSIATFDYIKEGLTS